MHKRRSTDFDGADSYRFKSRKEIATNGINRSLVRYLSFSRAIRSALIRLRNWRDSVTGGLSASPRAHTTDSYKTCKRLRERGRHYPSFLPLSPLPPDLPLLHPWPTIILFVSFRSTRVVRHSPPLSHVKIEKTVVRYVIRAYNTRER